MIRSLAIILLCLSLLPTVRANGGGEQDSLMAAQLIADAKAAYASDIEKSRVLALEVLRLADSLSLAHAAAESRNILGVYHQSKAAYLQSYELLTEALTYARQTSDSVLVSKILNNLGLTYKNTGRFGHAVDQYLQSLVIAEIHGDAADVAVALNNLGIVYKEMGDLNFSRTYNRKAYRSFEADSNYIGMSAALNNIGLLYKVEERYDSALYYLRESLALKERIGYERGTITTLYNIGETYSSNGLYLEALRYLNMSMEKAQKLDHKRHIAKIHDLIGAVYYKMGRPDDAIDHMEQSLKINEALDLRPELLENYSNISKALAAVGDSGRAYAFRTKELALKDSIFNADMRDQVMGMRFDYNLAAKDREIELLKSHQERDQLKLAFDRWVYVMGAVIIAMLSGLAVLLYRSARRQKKYNKAINRQKKELEKAHDIIQKKNDQLKEHNADLEEEVARRTVQLNELLQEFDLFVYKSAHDLRGPVAQVLGIAHLLDLDKDDPALLHLLKNTASEMDHLLATLTQIHQLRNRPIEKAWFDPAAAVRRLWDKIEMAHATDNHRLRISNLDKLEVFTDEDLMCLVCEELIKNSIQFNKGGRITIDIDTEPSAEGVHLIYRDNGTGIDPLFQKQIFDMFYRANDQARGHGLGLYKCSVILRRLDGDIALANSDQTGSTFVITMPCKVRFDKASNSTTSSN